MPFTKSEISKMTFDELRRVKLHFSKGLNKFAQGSERWNEAEALRLYVEVREDALEKQFIRDAKKGGSEFRRCSSCNKDKPIEDHPYGFMFRVGKTVTVCKRCQRNRSKSHHANNLDAGRARAEYHQDKRRALGKIDYSERDSIRRLQKDKCAYCGVDLNGGGELDHFIPVEYGGVNTVDNRVLACTTCNRNKGTKTPEEFLQWRKIHKVPTRRGGFYNPHKHMLAMKSLYYFALSKVI